MIELVRTLLAPRPWQRVLIDALDIVLLAYLIYRVLLILRGTRAMQMIVGLIFVGGIYAFGKWLGLVTVVTVLSSLMSSILLVVIVVFQSDLRRGLMRVGNTRPWFFGVSKQAEARAIDEIIAATTELARLRYGAIIAIERGANLDEFAVSNGTSLDAQVSRELLAAIFVPVGENKLHDGAVILRNWRIAQAGAFFPMPEKPNIDKKFGSRHRAAMGLASETDALAIVVSEERGTIGFCYGDTHADNLSPEELRQLLERFERERRGRLLSKNVDTTKKQEGKPSKRKSSTDSPPSAMQTKRASIPPPPLTPRSPLPKDLRNEKVALAKALHEGKGEDSPMSSRLNGPVSVRPPPGELAPEDGIDQ